jgi:hypothetical protein
MSALAPKPIEIADVRHIRVHGSKDTYCGHPRQGGIFNFGSGELAVAHFHAPCAYEKPIDVHHDEFGYHGRSVVLLQRSLDGGETWPEELNVVIWDEAAPLEERRQSLFQEGRRRQELDMTRPGAAFFFGRSWCGEERPDGSHSVVCFALRSADKGQTWENVPTIIRPPAHLKSVFKDNHPVVRMPDGSFLGAMTGGGGKAPGQVLLYGSDDDGVMWNYVAEIARDPTGDGRPTYAGLVLLPGGRLLCFVLQLGGRGHFIGMNHSDDGGYSWSELQPIVRWGYSPWRARLQRKAYGVREQAYGDGAWKTRRDWPWKHYRSPWPLLLEDGRVLVLFARRKPPFGIGGVVSEDQGRTWSQEFVIRDDGSTRDIGYPVATELEDGRIFTAYYFTVEDGVRLGGARFIGGSFFRV